MYYGEISLYLEVKTGNKMSGKKEEWKGILLSSLCGETRGQRRGKKCREGNEKQMTKIQDRCLSTRVGIVETFRGSTKGSKQEIQKRTFIKMII